MDKLLKVKRAAKANDKNTFNYLKSLIEKRVEVANTILFEIDKEKVNAAQTLFNYLNNEISELLGLGNL